MAAIEAKGRRAPDAVRERFGAERETILRAQRYEVEAIEALFDDHFDGLYRFCASLVGEAGAQELARRTWDRALEGLPRFRRFESGFGTWLERIALSLVNSVAPPVGGGAEDRLRIALRALPGDQLEVVGLRLVAGLPSAEIARATGRRRMRVEALALRGLQAVTAALNPPPEAR